MTTLKESSNRVHKFEKNGWLELYLPTSKSINYLQEDGQRTLIYMKVFLPEIPVNSNGFRSRFSFRLPYSEKT